MLNKQANNLNTKEPRGAMTSRERIMTAINHREPDRVPVDLGSTPSSGISAIAYGNLKKYLGFGSGSIRVYDVVQQLAQPEDEILDLFGADVLDLGRMFNTKEDDWHAIYLFGDLETVYPSWFQPVRQPDGSWSACLGDGTVVGRMPQGATFFDQTVFPYQDGYPPNYRGLPAAMQKVVWAALPHSPWDHASDTDFWRTLREKALWLRNNTDKAIMIVCGCNLFEWGTFLRRIDNFLMDLYTSPREVEELLDALMDIHLKTLEKVCEAVGDVADILRFGDDLGMDSGPFIPPEVYRRFFKHRHAQMCKYVKEHSRMSTFLHSCGSIYKLMPDLIEAGYDIINPVQTSCRDMEPEKLKREFGKDITFWGGGVDTRYILNRSTPQEVKDDVKRRLEIFACGGGFVFNTVHNILSDVPPENIMAMLEALNEINN